MLRLDDDTQESVSEAVPITDIKSEEGASKVLAELDKMFKIDESVNACEIYEQFVTYRRPADMNIADYCREFQQKIARLETSGTVLSEHVKAYRILKAANLGEWEEQLVKATTKKMTMVEMTKQMKWVFSGITAEQMQQNIKSEPEDYAQEYYRRRNECSASTREYTSDRRNFGGSGQHNNDNKYVEVEYSSDCGVWKNRGVDDSRSSDVKKKVAKKKNARNPLVRNGQLTRCRICESINHRESHCPDRELSKHATYQESGSDALPVRSLYQAITDAGRNSNDKVTYVVKNIPTDKVAGKLHSQFSHPIPGRLIKLVCNQEEEEEVDIANERSEQEELESYNLNESSQKNEELHCECKNVQDGTHVKKSDTESENLSDTSDTTTESNYEDIKDSQPEVNSKTKSTVQVKHRRGPGWPRKNNVIITSNKQTKKLRPGKHSEKQVQRKKGKSHKPLKRVGRKMLCGNSKQSEMKDNQSWKKTRKKRTAESWKRRRKKTASVYRVSRSRERGM